MNFRKCKNEKDVGHALSPLKEVAFIRERASIFSLESTGAVTADEVREVRAELREVERRYQEAEGAKQHSLDRLGRLNEATDDALQNSRREIERARKECEIRIVSQSNAVQDLSRLRVNSESKLRGLEAGFARKEILSFLKSKRYELTPLHLANAIAGLPYMGWRQSMRRSSKRPSKSANGLHFQIFKALRLITANARERNSEDNFVSSFREAIPKTSEQI